MDHCAKHEKIIPPLIRGERRSSNGPSETLGGGRKEEVDNSPAAWNKWDGRRGCARALPVTVARETREGQCDGLKEVVSFERLFL